MRKHRRTEWLAAAVALLGMGMGARGQEAAPSAAPDKARAEAIRGTLAVIEKQLAAHGGSWEQWAADLKPYRDDILGVTALKWPWPAKNGYVFQGAAHALHLRDSFDDLPDGERPLEGLVHFSRQLKALGIDLIVAIIPAKLTVYPDYLYAAGEGPQRAARAPADGVVSLALTKLMYDLSRNDVEVVNLHEEFRQFRLKNGDGVPLFYVGDGHYLNRGAQFSAEKIAERLKRYDFVQKALAGENPFVTEKGARTDGAKADDTLMLIKDRAGRPYQNVGDSPVFVLGDSHLGYNTSTAPFSGQIACRIALPVSEKWKEGLAAGIAVEVARDPNLKSRKVVVVHYSERMLRPRNGEPKWPLVNLPGVDSSKVSTAPLVTSGAAKPAAAATPAATPPPATAGAAATSAPVVAPVATPPPATAATSAPAVAPVAATPAVQTIKARVLGIAPDYMGNVPGRANVLAIGGDMVERGFGWPHYLALLRPEWRIVRVAAREWRVNEAAAEFDAAVAACAPADGVLLSFGEAECAAAYAKETTPDQFAEHLRQLVAKVRAHEKTKDAALALVTPFPVLAAWLDARTAPTYGAAAADERSRALAEAVRKVGAELKVPVVDLHKAALELAGDKPAADLKKEGFFAPTGYGTAPDGGALCGLSVSKALTEVFPVRSRDAEAGRKLAAYEAQLAELSRILAETSEGTVRSGAELEMVRAPNQPAIIHFMDETRAKIPADALQGRRWLTFVLRGADEGYIAVCAAKTDSPYDPKIEVTFADGSREEIRLPGYGHWSAISEETPDRTVSWERTSLNFGKNRLRPVSGGPAGKRRWTLMTFDVSAVGDRKVKEAALYFRYGNINQNVGPAGKAVKVALADGRDTWAAHGATTWRTRDGVRPWTGGKADAAARGAKLDEFLKKDLLPEVREAAAAERAALAAGDAGPVPRPAPQLATVAAPATALAAPAAPDWAKEPLRPLFITAERLNRIRDQAKAQDSHHGQALALLKARVDNPSFAAAYGEAGYSFGYKSVETALLAALAETEAERKKYAELAFKTMREWTNTGSATLGRSMEAHCLALTYNWAFAGWSVAQRVEMRERAQSVLAALGGIQHSNLGADRTSNFVGVIRGAELLLWLCTGGDVKSERCRFLVGELKQYFDNAFGDLGANQEGPGYTEYPGPFAVGAAIAAQECGDSTLTDAVQKHDFWRLLAYTRMAGADTTLFTSWGVSGNAGSGSGLASQLLHLCPPDRLPHYLWWYDRTVGRLTPPASADRFDGHRHGRVWALLFYPDPAVAAKDPSGTYPPVVADKRGYFFFRNHWNDAGSIMAAITAQTHKDQRGWSQPEQLAINLLAAGDVFIAGPDKNTATKDYSSLLVDGKYTYENATATMGKVVAFEPGKSGGYAIVQGGEMYEKLGVKEAVRHMRVEFMPEDTAIVATLDRAKSAGGDHVYTWQANVGDGIKVSAGNEGGRPFFLLKGAKASVKGWVLHPADAAVTAGDPLGVTVKGADAGIWVALYVGAGEPPQGVVTGAGLDSVLAVAGRKARFDAAANRIVVEGP